MQRILGSRECHGLMGRELIHGQLIKFPGEYMNKWRMDFTLPLG